MEGSRVRKVAIESPYAPRPEFMPFHDRKERWAVIVAHRRAGKTVACVNDLIRGCAVCKRPEPRFAYIAPYFNQAKDIAWKYAQFYSRCIPGMTYHESELRADFPGGARLRLYGGDNPDRLRGIYLDGVVLDEPADMDPRLWAEIIRPALSDRMGWAAFIGTPRGRNEFHRIYSESLKSDDWYSVMLRASETGIIPQAELADARKTMNEAQYQQEYECSFEAAIQGAYYAEQMAKASADKRITRVPFQPGLKVDTAWDLGFADPTAIWFTQRTPREIHVIDYWEESGADLAKCASLLQDKRQSLGYVYGEHVWPHDGKAHEQATGKRLDETMRALGVDVLINETKDVGPGIDTVRNILATCWFDEARCERGLETLRNYRAEWDDDKKTFKPRPLHDWASHGADAFRTFATHRPLAGQFTGKLKYDNRGIR